MAPDASGTPQGLQTKKRISKGAILHVILSILHVSLTHHLLACDNCRITKSRCERDSVDQDCRRCEQEGLDCTSDAPVRRRGPPKGYLQLVETRLHELEAIAGVLLSNPNPAVRDMFTTLSQDPFANNVLTQVANGAFGPRAIAKYATEHDKREATGSPSSEPQTPHGGGPTNVWQLQTVRTMVARSQTSESSSTSSYTGNRTPLESAWSKFFFDPNLTSRPAESSASVRPNDETEHIDGPYGTLDGMP